MNRSLFRTGLIALIFPLLSSGLLAELPEPDSMESHNLAVGVDYCKLEYSNLYGGTQRIYILRIDLSEPTIEVGFVNNFSPAYTTTIVDRYPSRTAERIPDHVLDSHVGRETRSVIYI